MNVGFVLLLAYVTQTALYEHGRNRTCDPQDRNLMLYPLSYMP